MKTQKTKLLIATVLIALSCVLSYSQKSIYENPKYGPDSASRMECLKNKSLYGEYYKQKNYKDAIGYWYEVFHNCPKASRNTYSHGTRMITYFINKENDPIKKYELVDTLMKIYDKRIKYFGTSSKYPKGWILGRKGVDYLKYKNSTIEDIGFGYNTLKESIELMKNKSEEAVLVTFMNSTESLYKAAKLSGEDVVETYAMLMDIIDYKLKNNDSDSKVITAKDNIDVIFERTGAITCEVIIDLFNPKFEATPDDVELLEKIVNLLGKSNCKEEDLYFFASEKLHHIKPTVSTAANIAEMAKNRSELDKAIQYYKEAITLDDSNITKAINYIQIAEIYRKKENPAESRSYAYKAISENPSFGEPYILIGNLYAASTSCGENPIEKAAIYWAAVDKYNKAKSINPELSEEANKYIVTYSKYFPDSETIFFHSLKEGDTYKVGCWINESTSVRAK